jgi:cytochrome b pre-mRNA-processing protein 3
MFFHYSIILLTSKIKGEKPDQTNYNNLFFHIENNLRELGFGDVSVNKKMKDLNNILYDILLKINSSGENSEFSINKRTILKYFNQKDQKKDLKYEDIETYFNDFFNFCFELSLDNMIKDLKKYKFNNGCT